MKSISSAIVVVLIMAMVWIFFVAPPCNGEYQLQIGGDKYLLFNCKSPFIASPTQSTKEKPTWSVESPKKYVVLLQDAGVRINICYEEGDGDQIGIDNSNSIDPKKGNFRFISKGSCAIYGIESGPNLGIFLVDGNQSASGTFERE